MGEGTRTLFGRIVLQNQDFFWGFMDQVASEMHTDVSVQHLSHLVEKPTMWFSNRVRHKPACTVTEDGYRLEILELSRGGIVLSE